MPDIIPRFKNNMHNGDAAFRVLPDRGAHVNLAVRYERRADAHGAFLTLGCALICTNAHS